MIAGPLLLAFSVILAWYAFAALRSGQVRMSGLLIERSNSPYVFWIGEAVCILMAVGGLLGGVQALTA